MIPQTPQDVANMPQEGPTLVLNLLAGSVATLINAWAAAASGAGSYDACRHADAAMLAFDIEAAHPGRERAEMTADLLALLAGSDSLVFLYEYPL